MYIPTSDNLLHKNSTFLKSLPQQTDFAVGKIRIQLFPGTLNDLDEELFHSAPASRFQTIAKKSAYQVQIRDHYDVPYYKTIDGQKILSTKTKGKNLGSL